MHNCYYVKRILMRFPNIGISLRTLVYLFLGIFLGIFLLTRDLAVSSSITVCSITQSICGTFALERLRLRPTAQSEKVFLILGPGLAVGSLIATFASLLFGPLVSFLLFLTFSVGLVLIDYKNSRTLGLDIPGLQTISILLSSSLLAFSSRSSVVLIMFLVALTIFLVLQSAQSLTTRYVVVGVCGVTLFSLFFLLPRFWWAVSNDFPYFIAVTEGISRFGVHDSIAIANHGITSWHWVTYGWIAATDILPTSDSWLRVLVGAPTIMTVSTVASLAILVKTVTSCDIKRALLISVFAIFAIGYFPPSLSYTIALSWLVAALTIFRIALAQHQSFLVLGLIVLTIGVVGGKPSGVPLLISVIAVSLFKSMIERKRIRHSFAFAITTILSIATYFGIFYRSSSASSNVWPAPLTYLSQLAGNIDYLPKSVLLAILIVVLILVFSSNAAQLLNKNSKSDILEIGSGLVLFPILFVLNGWADSMEYILYPCLLLSIAFPFARRLETIKSLRSAIRTKRPQRVVFCLSGLVVIVWCGINFSMTNEFKIFLLVMILGSQSLFEIRFHLNQEPPISTKRISSICMVLCFIPLVVPPKSFIVSGLASSHLRSDVEWSIGTKEVERVGKWLGANTKESSIIVTNYFCSGDLSCSSSNWWQMQIEYVKQHPAFYNEGCSFCNPDTLFGGADYSLAAYSDRRFLILGPRFQSGLGMPSEIVRDRVQISLDIVSELTKGKAPSVHLADVSHAVVFLPFLNVTSEKEALIQNADFVTENFIVVKL
jgi:hypothetical protein